MGIPSYFSQIIKKYGKIIHKFKHGSKSVHNFYLDSNSIIYDAINEYKKPTTMTNEEYERKIYEIICNNIEELIEVVCPANCVFIAFDGVAPLAKMKQQRERRYKSHVIASLEKQIKYNSFENTWDKTAITPGTNFMKNLNKYLKQYFNKFQEKQLSLRVIVSGTDDVGEGEHKIFSFMRQHNTYHSESNTMIYGLDSDLIMLCLNHLHISENIFLIREMPQFASVIQRQTAEPVSEDSSDDDEEELYMLDIKSLSIALMREMGCTTFNDTMAKRKMLDYVFISFMLGNDFLPHFPALNIRTNGMDILLDTYFDTIPEHKSLNDGKKINWKLFKKFVSRLAEYEHDEMKREYKQRNKTEDRFYPVNTVEERLHKMNSIPMRFRTTEKFIDPFTSGWEYRYYDKLLHITSRDSDIFKRLCVNYLEGLEWVMKYYHSGCVNYRWEYKHSYPPLLVDLVKYIPTFSVTFVEENMTPVNEITQLSYVLPVWSLKFLPEKLHVKLLEEYGDNYSDKFHMEWSYCKYFWEAHPELNSIDLDEFEETVMGVIDTYE